MSGGVLFDIWRRSTKSKEKNFRHRKNVSSFYIVERTRDYGKSDSTKNQGGKSERSKLCRQRDQSSTGGDPITEKTRKRSRLGKRIELGGGKKKAGKKKKKSRTFKYRLVVGRRQNKRYAEALGENESPFLSSIILNSGFLHPGRNLKTVNNTKYTSSSFHRTLRGA